MARIQTPNGRVRCDGDTEIAGVPGARRGVGMLAAVTVATAALLAGSTAADKRWRRPTIVLGSSIQPR